jgi:hypothetical protein
MERVEGRGGGQEEEGAAGGTLRQVAAPDEVGATGVKERRRERVWMRGRMGRWIRILKLQHK